MHMEVGALFGRFAWHGITSMTSQSILPEVRGSIPHWRCANTTGLHTVHKPGHRCDHRRHVVFVLPLGYFPVGIANRTCLGNRFLNKPPQLESLSRAARHWGL